MSWSKHIYLLLCRGDKGRRKKKSMLSLAEFPLVFHKAVTWLFTSRHCRIALLHSLCIGLPGFFSVRTGLAFSFSFCCFSVLFFVCLFSPSFLPSLGCHTQCSDAAFSGAPSGQCRWIIFQTTGAAVSCIWPQKDNGLYRFCSLVWGLYKNKEVDCLLKIIFTCVNKKLLPVYVRFLRLLGRTEGNDPWIVKYSLRSLYYITGSIQKILKPLQFVLNLNILL